jgi:hypothetical protein
MSVVANKSKMRFNFEVTLFCAEDGRASADNINPVADSVSVAAEAAIHNGLRDRGAARRRFCVSEGRMRRNISCEPCAKKNGTGKRE